MSYITVQDPAQDEIVEIPVEANDESVLISSLNAQFAGAIGLKYKNADTGAMRGLRVDDGKIFSPADGWQPATTYVAVFPKTEVNEKSNKRKINEPDTNDDDDAEKSRMKRIKRKCFDLIVLGLPYKTTEEELREHFEQFGAVVVSQVKMEAKSGKSKGFGFIRMGDWESQQKVLMMRHFIDGRRCDVRVPSSRDGDSSTPMTRKVFVGRIPESLTVEDLRDFFETFGDVTDVFIPKPFRSFAFVTFADGDVAQNLCGEDVIIKGSSVSLSSAIPKHIPPQDSGPYETRPAMWTPGGGPSKFAKPNGSVVVGNGYGRPPISREYGDISTSNNANENYNGNAVNGSSNGFVPHPTYGQPVGQNGSRPGIPMGQGAPPTAPVHYNNAGHPPPQGLQPPGSNIGYYYY